MLKGALLTIGILAVIGGGGLGFLSLLGAGMSDSPSAADASFYQVTVPCAAVVGIGLAMIVAALIIHT